MTDAIANHAHSELEPREDRRLSPRSRLTEIVYVNMQAENGGILLDISSSGFGFQVASPISAEREIKFRFSAEGIEDLEITANIAWLDSDRKRGGVTFGQLSEKVRSRVIRWIGIPTTPDVVLPETMIRRAAESAVQTQHSKSDQNGRSLISESNPYSLTQERSQQGSSRTAVSDRPLEGLPNPLRANSSFRPIFSSEPKPETEHNRRHFGVVAMSIFLLLLAGAGIFISNKKHQVGVSMIRSGERLSGEHSQQPANLALPTVSQSSVTSAPGPPEFATEEPQTAPPSDATANASGSGSPGREATPKKSQVRRADDPAREDDGHTELALARQYLRGSSVPKDRDMAAHLLWVAVGDGNPQAELELAGLYLLDDGVPVKNCAQARILLNDASNSGNVEAGQQLAKLRDYGCR